MTWSAALFIGKRYASLRSRSLLVGFISILSVIGLSIGVAIVITALSVINGFERELETRILALVPHISISSARTEGLMSEAEWLAIRESIQALPEVKGTAPQIQLQGLLLANGKSKGVVLNGIDPVQEQSVSIMDEFVIAGNYQALATDNYQIVIGNQVAEQLAVSVGDSVTLVSTVIPITPMGEFTRQKTFTVGAIFQVGSQLDSSFAQITMADAQRLYRLGNNIHGYRVQLNDIDEVYPVVQQLRTRLPEGLAFSDWTYEYASIFEHIRVSKSLVGLLLSLLIAIAAFNIIVSLIMVIKDKQGDIAILRTMGTSLTTIRNIFLIQGVIIGFIGTSIGLVSGVLLSLSAGRAVGWLEQVFQIQFLSSDIYPINYLPSQIQLNDLIIVCLVSMLLTVLATLYPARSAALVKPAEILRYE